MLDVDLQGAAIVERRDGHVWAQPQPYGQKGTGISYEAMAPFGLMGRPRQPTNGGVQPNVLVFRDGPEGFTLLATDPRYQELLPDTGEGGAALYGCIEQGGSKTPHVAVYGAKGALGEGTIQIVCRSSAGDSTMTWDPTTGDVTIVHPSGTKINVKASGVELGADGGQAVALALPITAWAATVEARFATLGQSGTPPAGVAATKVNAT